METETYKNAKVILERFDPEAKRKAVSAVFFLCVSVALSLFYLTFVCCCVVLQELESTPVRPQMTPRPGQGMTHVNTEQKDKASQLKSARCS